MKKLNIPNGMEFKSFAELGNYCGCKPVIKQTKDKEKLGKQREKFCSRHLCPSCKQPMHYVDLTNVFYCNNPECKGIKIEYEDLKTGEKRTEAKTPFHLLDEKSSEIAENIFAELD